MKHRLLIGTILLGTSVVVADDKQLLREMMDADKRGDAHKVLDDLRKEWIYTVKWSLTPESTPEEGRGTVEFTWILDGKFLFGELKDQRLGISFQEHLYITHDNAAKDYVMVEADVTGTKILVSRGQAEGNVLTLLGEYAHPTSGAAVKTRTVFTIDKKDPLLERYETPADGAEYKSLEIKFSKQRRIGA